MADTDKGVSKIKAFVCTWSHFTHDDIGEAKTFQYAPDISMDRIVCSGSFDPEMVFDAFLNGADAVFVGTCEPGTCRFEGDKTFKAGNRQTAAKMLVVKAALKVLGLEEERLKSEWLSPKAPKMLKSYLEEFRKSVTALGPIPKNPSTVQKLETMKNVFHNFRVRWLIGKKLELTTFANTYKVQLDGKRFNTILEDVLYKEFVRASLLFILDKGPATVEEMASKTNFTKKEVLDNIIKLRQRGLVSFYGEKNDSPTYSKEGEK